MNKLVIIGNGFDRAHGLPTSYEDFINWLWKNIENIDDELVVISKRNQKTFENKNRKEILDEFKKSYPNRYIECSESGWSFDKSHDNGKIEKVILLRYTNSFFGRISEQHSTQNWVNIENEYYKLLKECLKESGNGKVKKLNEEFEQIKNLLERYLNEEIINKYDFEKPNEQVEQLIRLFLIRHISLDNSKYLEEFPQSHHKEIRDEIGKINRHYKDGTLRQEIWNNTVSANHLFLNFNYTYSVDKFKSYMNRDGLRDNYGRNTLIQIHGRLDDPDNKINFGFGDEMDDLYKQIEEKDDNEYLKYIKSFQYLQNSNYKQVLDYIESDIFQVYIMGHSCGLSDRILLNTIFEHPKCVSIKVFYHEKPDGSDNYTEIVQNISRHFNKKKMMRDKIVNKSLCVPLPQDIRFEKLNTP